MSPSFFHSFFLASSVVLPLAPAAFFAFFAFFASCAEREADANQGESQIHVQL